MKPGAEAWLQTAAALLGQALLPVRLGFRNKRIYTTVKLTSFP